MEDKQELDERLKKVLKRAKNETYMKDVSTLVFARFFSTLLAILAPFLKKNNTKG
ncbi:hypothetical protein KJ877_02535 [bacterium]|nr:hypothetical protein [bacterium]MBU1990633.1 hypothetical protein [bacterium]